MFPRIGDLAMFIQRHSTPSPSQISDEGSKFQYTHSITSQPLLTSDAAPISVSNWPLQPQELRPRKRHWIVHAIAIVVVVPYVMLALFALAGPGTILSQATWDGLQIAIQVAVTIFPVAFAAIISRMLRQISQWQLERAIPLGRVEQLRRSSTVFGTLSILFVLRSLNLVGVGLLILWALSPLGAQSALRILSADLRQHNSSIPLAYLDLAQSASQHLDEGLLTRQNDLADQLFVSSILAPSTTRLSSMDAWGNVKIPFVTDFPDDHTWKSVDGDTAESALLGLPVLGLPQHSNVSLTLDTSFMTVDCFQFGTNTHAKALRPSAMSKNGVPMLIYIPDNSIGTPPGHEGPIIRWSSPDYPDAGEYHYTIANCSLSQTFLSANITCLSPPNNTHSTYHSSSQQQQQQQQQQQRTCKVTAVRQTPSQHNASTTQAPPLLSELMNPFGIAMMNSTPLGHPFSPTIEDHYLNSIDNFNNTSMDAISALSSLPAATFSLRLSQLINTYYLARLGYETLMIQSHTYTVNTTTVDIPTIGTLATTTGDAITNNAGPTLTSHTPWVVVYIVAVVMLVAAVVVTPIVQGKTLTPDILGYVSSLTRENPFVGLPAPASTLSGFERARLLGSVRVRFGDVRGGDEVGRLGVGRVDRVARSRVGRKYS